MTDDIKINIDFEKLTDQEFKILVITKLLAIESKVDKQDGRVHRLERWQARTIGIAIGASAIIGVAIKLIS